MKASIKFREDQKPLLRAKLPLNILGLPFQSGVAAGDSKDLTLHLSSFFQSGPCIKLAYRPNDSANPFSLFLKTGTGPFGSSHSSSMLMTAEFSLVSRDGNFNPSPRFMLHFKPQFGDFCVKKSQSSTSFFEKTKTADFTKNSGVLSDDDGSLEVAEIPVANGFLGKKTTLSAQKPTARAVAAALSGVEMTARTNLPIKSRAVMSFRWGVRVPAEINEPTFGINFKKIPFLVMNKIGIEHVYGGDALNSMIKEVRNDDVEETSMMMVKREVEWLRRENLEMRKAVDELRREIGFKGKVKMGDNGKSKNDGRSYRDDGKTEMKKSMEMDLSEEVSKSSKGAANVSAGGPASV